MVRKSSQPRTRQEPARREFTLAEKVAFLSRPDAYGEEADSVETVETHMSWVFLTERYAHKLKKPVSYEFLDFRSREARRHSCEEEIRLNRRLAPEVYIGTVPLVAGAAGELHLGGGGEAVDWLVRMHRLPAARMLDRAIEVGSVREGDLQAVARLLADFYAGAVAVAMPPDEYRGRLAAAILQNKEGLADPDFGLPKDTVRAVYEALGKMLVRSGALFEERVRAACVVEGHGDLRPEHVYLGPGPAIIDCLEFNRGFRILDRADELAYLAMECERLGAPEAGAEILETCCRMIGDEPPAEIVHFYKAHRALLRARLAIMHLQDEDVRDREKWRPRALDYLALAEVHARQIG